MNDLLIILLIMQGENKIGAQSCHATHLLEAPFTALRYSNGAAYNFVLYVTYKIEHTRAQQTWVWDMALIRILWL
jgi:uncharacterized membrane protein